MARQTREFTAFGIAYRTKQFDAVSGMRFVDTRGADHPCRMLATTEAWHDGAWHSLATPENINRYVYDGARCVSPLMVLRGIVSVIREFNFSFIGTWKGVRVPSRFLTDVDGVASQNVLPMISALIQQEAASLKELEEYYSLEDAFKMFDVMTSKGVNEALANERAMKKAERR
jgi:hypothetical protein